MDLLSGNDVVDNILEFFYKKLRILNRGSIKSEFSRNIFSHISNIQIGRIGRILVMSYLLYFRFCFPNQLKE